MLNGKTMHREGECMVFLFFLIGIILLIILGIIFSVIKLEIKELNVSNLKKEKIEVRYIVLIKLYLYGYLKCFQVKMTEETINTSNIFNKLFKRNFKDAGKDLQSIFEILKVAKPEMEKINMRLKVGTEVLFITTVITVLISLGISYIFSAIIKKANPKCHKYKIEPVYNDKNLIDLKLDCIIKVKMVHIINIIYIFLKKRRGLKYERTSNRRVNDDSNEQHSRYGRCQHDYRGTN